MGIPDTNSDAEEAMLIASFIIGAALMVATAPLWIPAAAIANWREARRRAARDAD